MSKKRMRLIDAHQLSFDFDFIEVMTEEEAAVVEIIKPKDIIKWQFEYASKENILIQFPFLRWHQGEDISRCENMFFNKKQKGVQVTNGTGVGKAQPLYSKILTPNGWKTMGEIKKGDFVISREGKPIKVLEVYPQGKKEIFRVHLSDGTYTDSCKEHLWETQTLYERRKSSSNPNWNCAKPKVRSLEEISKTIDKRHFLPIVNAVQFKEKEYKIKPYLLGVLLGDGGLSGSNIIISSADKEILEKCSEDLENGFLIKHINNYDYNLIYHTKNEKTEIKSFYHNELRRLKLKGTKSNNKFIPEEYLLGSVEQRIELLKGILDTDGCVNHYRSAEYCTVSNQLALDVRSLVNSLGGVCTISEKKTKGQLAYNLVLNLPEGLNPFFVSRKREKFKTEHKYLPKRVITSVESIGEYEAQCILVDDPSHLYVTDNYILTHNTYLGLGLANRFIYKNKTNILIVVPTDKKAKDWIRDNKRFFESSVRQIESTSTIPLNENKQPGMVICTYSTFYQNELLNEYVWDLIIYDESHRLMENGQKKDTVYLKRHREISRMPSGFRDEYLKDHLPYPEGTDEVTIKTYGIYKNGVKGYYKDNFDKVDTMMEMSLEIRNKLMEDYTQKTKILFLSASPFAYHFNTEIGDGALWNIRENYSLDTKQDLLNYESGRAYNSPGRYERFFIENFGFSMRTNKLSKPDPAVNVSLMERMFFEKYNKLGVIFGRQIEVEKDYSREFVLLNSEIGNQIDEGLSIFHDAEFKKNYSILVDVINYKIDYIYKNQLLESLKSMLFIPRLKQHLELGRKVVVFHDYNNSRVGHPFHFSLDDFYDMPEDYRGSSSTYLEQVRKFEIEYPHLIDIDIDQALSNPVDEILKNFDKGRVAIFSGKISNKKRSLMKDNFQDDLSGVDIICIQRQAGKEGIDLHDTTGVYQRVLMDLGLPRRPTDSIQCEGRTYRDGVMSDAIWEYMIINTIFESTTFSSVISERASTAENLAMGNKARNLKASFKQGYIDYVDEGPNNEQGKGGKEKDFSYNSMSEFDLATALYYTNLKKTSKNKATEGKDYFATPEPLGFKMVEWLNISNSDRILEPSAGHGAIARFFPEQSYNYVIEPSRNLMSKLMLNCNTIKSDNFIDTTFELHDTINKYHGIAMNPPFGNSSKLALEHLEKAVFKHLFTYELSRYRKSRVICILPDSLSTDKGLEKMFSEDYINKDLTGYEKNNRIKVIKNVKISYEIKLPSVTFNRAGTSVRCKIIVVDLINDFNEFREKVTYDFSHIEKIEDFFSEIENLHLPNFIPVKDE